MSDWDAVVACPTCRHVFRPPEEQEEDAHLQPCPECGYALMLVVVELDDEDDRGKEIRVRWDEGEGAPLFMADAARAITLAEEFWNQEEAEEERIETVLTEMRRERAEQAGD
ncbi:MAG TPA: hypothetical protein VD761_00740 [Solirubrobacterales bacterium]|nr:hypothetical protein [Solirubrobacterales bacterium]